MIARSGLAEEPPDWQSELREAWRDPAALLRHLGIEPLAVRLADASATGFAFRVTRAYAARMRRGDPDDPLLRQVLPAADELVPVDGYSPDPVGEQARHADGALVRKYRGRALLLVTGACAINCRYCFRRAHPYGDALGEARLAHAFRTLREDPGLREIILSGGDPLVADDETLARIVRGLAAIPHLRRLRVHTRLPVVLPSRITPGLVDALAGTRLPTALVIHANHPAEIDDAVRAALGALRSAGITLLNQAVLLRGVNDDETVLAALSETLFDAGVLPYYVNLLDRVSGSAHFDVSEDEVRTLRDALTTRLPGYLVPRFVREVDGAPSKQPLR